MAAQPPTGSKQKLLLKGNDKKGYKNVAEFNEIDRQIKEQFFIIGKGQLGDQCGQIIPLFNCQSCGKVHFVRHRCRKKQCPECWQLWQRSTTDAAIMRLSSNEAKYTHPRMPICHVVISPGPDMIKEAMQEAGDQWEKYLRRKCQDYLKSKSRMRCPECKSTMQMDKTECPSCGHSMRSRQRWPSGILISHTFRDKPIAAYLSYLQDHGHDQRYEKIKKEINAGNQDTITVPDFSDGQMDGRQDQTNAEQNKKVWAWIRERDSWQQWVNGSPHYHFIGYTPFLEAPQEGEKWIYKKRTDKNGRILALNHFKGRNNEFMAVKRDHLYRVLNYVLSHTVDMAAQDHYRSYVWIGDLSTRNGRSREEIERDEAQAESKHKNGRCRCCSRNKCKDCGATFDMDLAECPSCGSKNIKEKGGRLWYVHQNYEAFCHQWLGIYQGLHDHKYIRRLIRHDPNIPDDLKLHYIQLLDIWIHGRPDPADVDRYILKRLDPCSDSDQDTHQKKLDFQDGGGKDRPPPPG